MSAGRYLRRILAAGDWVIFNLAFGLALCIYPLSAVSGVPSPVLWVLVNLSFMPVLVRMFRSSITLRAFSLDRVFGYSLGNVGLHALFFMSLVAFLGITGIPARFYVLFYGILAVVATLWSVFSHRLIKAYRRRGYNYKRVVIVGTNSTARRLYEEMLSDTGFGYKIMGFFDREWKPDFVGRYCGSLDQLEEFVRKNMVDQIYYTMPGHHAAMSDVVKIADDNMVEFFYVPQISQYVSRGFKIETIGAMPVLAVRRNPLRSPLNRAIKRSFDIVFSSLFLLFYPLIYIPVAIAIKISSPGPVYFRQKRTGYHGKEFQCLKFRTMKVNATADSAQATKDDPRKTRLGEFLRRTSLDELPQFINVLRGEMSVVGPRPHMLKHTEDYSKLVDRYMLRHIVKPGITGWAQVNGYRGITDELWKMEKRVEYDVWYVENWSFLLDLKIVVRTVMNAVHGESNAF